MSEHVYNKEVERAVLGAVLSASDTESQRLWAMVHDVIGTPLAFYSRDHQLIALVISELWQRGKPCDLMTVYDGSRQVSFSSAMDGLAKLRGRKTVLEFDTIPHEESVAMAVGGVSVLGELMSARGSMHERAVKSNAHIIADHYRQREAIRLASTAIGKLQSPSGRTDLRPIVDGLTESLIKVIGGRSGTRNLDEALESVIATHNEAKNQEKRKMPQWPLGRLNQLCRFRDGSFVVLAATSGGGKTSLALQTAEASAEYLATDGCIGIISREMTAEDLTRILAARRCGFTVEQIERGELPPEQIQNAVDNVSIIAKKIMVCDALEKLTHREVCAWARSQHTRTNGGLRMLIVDHLGLLDPENPRQSEYERTTAATRALKALAMELKIVVLALCQLNRDAQKRNLGNEYGAEDFTMSALKGSGSIENDADQVVFICKTGADSGHVLPARIKVEKNRWGAKGEFPVVFDKAHGQQFRLPEAQKKNGGMPQTTPDDSEDLFH